MYRENPEQADDRQYYDYHLDRNGRSLEAENEALRQPLVSGMLKCASCNNTAKKEGLDCYGKCHICTQAF